jgi:hypothetical protein
MADPDPSRPEPQPRLTAIVRAANEIEAQLICSRLSEAGIHSVQALVGWAGVPPYGMREGAASPREISVDSRDAARAREILSQPAVSEAELIQAEEEDAAHRDMGQE